MPPIEGSAAPVTSFDIVTSPQPQLSPQHSFALVPPSPPKRSKTKQKKEKLYEGKTFYLFGTNHTLRRPFIWLNEQAWFTNFILFNIVANCIFLMMDGPYATLEQQAVNQIAETWFTYIFVFECLSKILALGFVFGKHAYLKDRWNMLDFFVVLTSLMDPLKDAKILPDINMSFLRTLRVLRPLRTLSVIPGMRVIVGSLIDAMGSDMMGNVVLLLGFVIVLFGIVALQFFQSKLRNHCYDLQAGECLGGDCASPDSLCMPDDAFGGQKCFFACPEDTTYVPYTKYNHASMFNDTTICALTCSSTLPEIGIVNPGENPNFGLTSFDNFPVAFSTIFQCITMEGWTDIMYMLMDSAGPYSYVYFILLILFGSWFALNLLLAVISDTYNDVNEENERLLALDIEEEHLEDILMFIPGLVVIPSDEVVDVSLMSADERLDEDLKNRSCRRANGCFCCNRLNPVVRVCRRINDAPWLDRFVTLLIVLNTITLCLNFHGAEDIAELVMIQEITSMVFNIAFTVELILKMIALGILGYLADPFNKFDTFVVFISWADFLLSGGYLGFSVSGIKAFSALRAMRIMRVLKLVKSLPELRKILSTLMASFENISYVTMVMSLVMLIFAISGVQFFGGILENMDGGVPRSNFDAFFPAFTTIFQILTGENWNEVMYNCYEASKPYGTSEFTPIFFMMVNIIGNMIMLNLFLAVLLSNFEGIPKEGIMDVKVSTSEEHDDFLAANGYEVVRTDDTEVTHGQGGSSESLNEGRVGAFIKDGKDASVWVKIGGAEDDDLSPISHLGAISIPDSSKGNWRESIRELRSQGADSGAVDTAAAIIPSAPKVTAEAVLPEDWEVLIADAGKDAKTGLTVMLVCCRADKSGSKPIQDIRISVDSDTPAFDTEARSYKPVMDRRQAVLVAEDDENVLDNVIHLDRNGSVASVHFTSMDDPEAAKMHLLMCCTDKMDAPPFHHAAVAPAGDNRDSMKLNSIVPEEAIAASSTGTGTRVNVRSAPDGSPEAELDEASDDASDDGGALIDFTLTHMNSADEEGLPDGLAFCCLSPGNGLRRMAIAINQSNAFSSFIVILIAFSCVLLAIDEPLTEEQVKEPANVAQKEFIDVADLILTIIFVFEMVVKMLDKGFLFGPRAYWRDAWCQLDGVIVAVSVVPWFMGAGSSGSLRAFKAIRGLRALRPLRLISRVRSLQVVINAIIKTVPAVLNTLGIVVIFILIFAILAVMFWMGRVNYCVCDSVDGSASPYDGAESPFICLFNRRNGSAPTRLDGWANPLLTPNGTGRWNSDPHGSEGVWLTKEMCTDTGMMTIDGVAYRTSWERPGWGTFDDVFQAMQALFEVATLEGWLDVMYAAQDIPDAPGLQPRREYGSGGGPFWSTLYFIIYIIVAAFLFMNVFVGVVIDNFNDIKEKNAGSVFMTTAQMRWIESQSAMIGLNPEPVFYTPLNPFRRVCYDLVWKEAPPNAGENQMFSAVVMLVIGLNTLSMALSFHGSSDEYRSFFEMLSLGFNIFYVIEACIKLMAFGVTRYLHSYWNRFDLFIVAASLLGMLISPPGTAGGGGTTTQMISFLRVARVARVFKLVKSMKGLNKLVTTLIKSIPSLINIAILLMLLFFVFACMGMNLFSEIGMNMGDVPEGFGAVPGLDNLNRHANFRTFGNSLLLLFRMSTGEYWNGIMHDCTITPANSDCIDGQNCGEPIIARVFFIVFIIVGQFMLLNLFIAVILDAFGSSEEDDDNCTEDDYEQFQQQWQRLDPEATGWIETSEIRILVKNLPKPLGIHGSDKKFSPKELDRLVAALNVDEGEHKHAGRVPFHQVLTAMAERTSGVFISKELGAKVTALGDLEKATAAKRDISPAFNASHVKEKVGVEIVGAGLLTKIKVISVEYRVTWKSLPQGVGNFDEVYFESVNPALGGLCKLSNGSSFKNPETKKTMSDRYAALMVQKVFRAKQSRQRAALKNK